MKMWKGFLFTPFTKVDSLSQEESTGPKAVAITNWRVVKLWTLPTTATRGQKLIQKTGNKNVAFHIKIVSLQN